MIFQEAMKKVGGKGKTKSHYKMTFLSKFEDEDYIKAWVLYCYFKYVNGDDGSHPVSWCLDRVDKKHGFEKGNMTGQDGSIKRVREFVLTNSTKIQKDLCGKTYAPFWQR